MNSMVNKFCPECGANNPDEALFCQECGNKIRTEELLDLNKFADEPKEVTKLKKGKHWVTKGKISVYSEGLELDNKYTGKITKFPWNQITDVKYSRAMNRVTITTSNNQKHVFIGRLNPLTMKSDVTKGIYLLTNQMMCGVLKEEKIEETKEEKFEKATDSDCIRKMESSAHNFMVEIPIEIEEAPKKIKDKSGTSAGATLLGGMLFGPVGALAGYAATKGPTVVQTGPIKKIAKKFITFKVSVHEKGIKMIKKTTDPMLDNVIKIPWDQILNVFYTTPSYYNTKLTIRSLNNEDITLKGENIALKGLYLITKDRMSGYEEKVEGWE